METNVVVRNSKNFRLVIKWGDKKIDLGNIEFKTDGSLIFVSKFHNDKEFQQNIEFGTCQFIDNKFYSHISECKSAIENGYHISLHPNGQTMHFKGGFFRKILYKRNINWFPVIKPFNLLYLYTLPLDTCKKSQKIETFITPIDKNYFDSLVLKVDLFPRNTKEHFPYNNSIFVLGYCPNYFVRVSLMLARQRTAALLYWPEGKELSL